MYLTVKCLVPPYTSLSPHFPPSYHILPKISMQNTYKKYTCMLHTRVTYGIELMYSYLSNSQVLSASIFRSSSPLYYYISLLPYTICHSPPPPPPKYYISFLPYVTSEQNFGVKFNEVRVGQRKISPWAKREISPWQRKKSHHGEI